MATAAFPSRSDFEALLNETLGGANEGFEGRVVKGTVTAIENDMAVIDVGLKSEGRVPLREFAAPGQKAELNVGDEVEVFVDRVENVNGEAMLSRDRARREAAWDKLEHEFAAGNRVDGVIFGRVKGGFTVDLGGAVAFLPGSQVDIRPVRDVQPLMDIPQPFQILKMDRRRGNIVVSRRAILEETRAEQRSGLIQSLHEGQVVDGVVKNITDYGAFVELEPGIEGLIHVSEMSWTKKNVHPGKIVSTSQEVDVAVLEVDEEKRRISLGLKQAQANPWSAFAEKHPVGTE
ncbi:MAG TPA: S1 RNA-binding domain-containing protein, partial [Sphingomonas sp.]|nr:S1 RNA-binding domain-containing protein [Sphingomonas sp.]